MLGVFRRDNPERPRLRPGIGLEGHEQSMADSDSLSSKKFDTLRILLFRPSRPFTLLWNRTSMNQRKIVAGLFLASGFTGLVYEVVWIRLFSLNFGNTAQALSTVAAVYLGGLAIGAVLAGRLTVKSPMDALRYYGIAEILTGAYALAIPSLIQITTPWLASVYDSGGNTLFLRAVLCVAILAPATVFMGATLPLLAMWNGNSEQSRGLASLYSLNLAGAASGALLSGLSLLPMLGYSRTLWFACGLNIAIGVVAMVQKGAAPVAEPIATPKPAGRQPKRAAAIAPVRTANRTVWLGLAFFSGFVCMLFEVAWARVSGLLLGPTASTVTLMLGSFLAGLAIAAILTQRILRNNNLRAIEWWLCGAQIASVILVAWAYLITGAAPGMVAEWVSTHSDAPGRIELMKFGLLSMTVTPLAIALGATFPLLLRVSPNTDGLYARYVGGVYGINAAGCIVGSLLTGWLLIPLLGTQPTVFAGGILCGLMALAMVWNTRPALLPRAAIAMAGIVAIVIFVLPRWNMERMTAGGYKYAEYTSDQSLLGRGQLAYLREGVSGTVVVRKNGGSTILAIDGKVDATDAGGDLLTEKLLAHIPLLLARNQESVCLIGLASGVTAGAALTYPIDSLDVLEVSREVVEASHFFDAANGRPLEDRRTKLIVNDGRNHLLLTGRRYDVIVSEPSNPWIAGMNNLFTRDFFRIAKSRLQPGGLFAQWFHIYNMPGDDLRSLMRAFHEVFPTAALWRMNDGDVLLTGIAGEEWPSEIREIPATAKSDLNGAGVDDPMLLWSMYVMGGEDIGRFAGDAKPNTDDRPWLEFHGQRDLHAQTDSRNVDELEAFARTAAEPARVAAVRQSMNEDRYLSVARMFERAESYRSAFRNYQAAFRMNPHSMQAMAGMDRNARQPQEHQAVALALGLPGSDSLKNRTEYALQRARGGDIAKAQFLFAESAAAFPNDPSTHFNFGVFSMEQNDYRGALALFEQTIALDPRNIPAHEAIAEVHLKLHDYPQAAKWSRRILELDPNHATARQILNTLEREVRN